MLGSQAKEQALAQKEASQDLRLENDRLKFEVVQVAEQAQKEVARLQAEIAELREAFGDSASRLEDVQRQCLAEVASRDRQIAALRRQQQDENAARKSEGPERSSQTGELTGSCAQLAEDQALSERSNGSLSRQKSESHSRKQEEPWAGDAGGTLHTAESSDPPSASPHSAAQPPPPEELASEREQSGRMLRLISEESELFKKEAQHEASPELLQEVRKLQERLSGSERLQQALLEEKEDLGSKYAQASELLRKESARAHDAQAQVANLSANRRRLEAELAEWRHNSLKAEELHLSEVK